MLNIKVTKPPVKESNPYPKYIFDSLDPNAKLMVIESNFNVNKTYLVGRSSLLGCCNFPKNVDIGIKYIEKSIQNGSERAMKFYAKYLITNPSCTQQDIDKAQKLISKVSDQNSPYTIFIKGLIYRKQHNLEDAIRNIENAANNGVNEALFYYGKMLYYGDGCKRDKEKADKCFNIAKQNGCNKVNRYLCRKDSKFSTNISNSPYCSSFDIIFMINKTEAANNFLSFEKLSSYCNNIIYKLWKQHPKVYFRFGIVFDTKENDFDSKDHHNLVKTPSSIENFLLNTTFYPNSHENLISGYNALVNRIKWDENAKKVVIHLAFSPEINNKAYQLDDLIHKIVAKKINIFCMNIGSNESNILKNAKELYEKNNGEMFIIQDLIGNLDYETFEKFVCNAVVNTFSESPKNKINCECSKDDIFNENNESLMIEANNIDDYDENFDDESDDDYDVNDEDASE